MKKEQIKFELRLKEKEMSFIEETHEYHKGKIKYTSVTTLIGMYHDKFDAKRQAPFTARKLGISTEEVLKMWKDGNKEATDKGTACHLYLEKYYNGIEEPINDHKELLSKAVGYVMATKDDLIGTEYILYNDRFRVSGQTDFLLYDPGTESIIVMDWKTNKEIKFEGYNGKKMNYPVAHLNDSNFYHYELQMSFYRYFLEEWGFKVKGQTLVHLHDEGYEEYDCRYLKKEVMMILIDFSKNKRD